MTSLPSRRPPGAGTIRKRGNTYQVLLRVTDDSGRSRQLSRTAPTHAAAQMALGDLIRERDSFNVTPNATTFGVLCVRWRESIEAKNPSPASLDTYDQHLQSQWIQPLMRKRLSDITAADLDWIYTQMSEAGLSPNTILGTHSFIRMVLTQARRWGWITTNPADDARNRPTVARRRITLPTAADLEKLLSEADSHPDPTFSTFIRLAIATGARRGELCALQRRSVDAGQYQLLIWQRAVYGGTGRGVSVQPGTKSGKPRSVPVSKDVIARLSEFIQWRESVIGGEFPDLGYLFSNDPYGSIPGNPNTMTMRWRELMLKTGLSGVRLHDMRHLAATSLFSAKLPASTVSRILGHSTTSITQDVYAQYVPESGAEAAEILGKLGFGQ